MLAAEAGAGAGEFSAPKLRQLFDGLAGEPGVAIAVSGGSDSMALLRLALEWRAALRGGPRLVALTVEHGLRAGSADEAQIVAAHCARLGIEHHTLVWEGMKPATGIQAKARAARYGLLTEWCRKNGVAALATAHTADDQAETVLMRSRRTGSAESLAGIWPERRWNGVRIARPLLRERRQALRQYLGVIGQVWIEDPSNENERFERVRVRRQLAGGGVAELSEKAEHAQAEVLAGLASVKGWIAGNVTVGKAFELRLPAHAVATLNAEERLVLCRVLAGAARGEVTAERAELLRLAQWLSAAEPGVHTLNGLVFQKKRNDIIIGREPGRIPPVWREIEGRIVWDQRFSITAPAGSRVGPALLAPGIARLPDIPFWLHRGLPVVELPTGERILAISPPGSKDLERLGIAVAPTYVNGLEGLPVA